MNPAPTRASSLSPVSAPSLDHRRRITPPRQAMFTPPPRRPLPQLIDDLIPEILLRIPPDDPACLARASLACKLWRSVLTDPAFLRSYRAFHRTPPVLGFLCNTISGGVPSARFVPTSSFHPAASDRCGMHAISARHGRVLLRPEYPDEGLFVWDPFTDEQWAVPPLPATPLSETRYNATVFCAAAGCDHLDCHGGPFAVAFVGSCPGSDRAIACVYSSEAGEWGEPTVLQGVLLCISYAPGVHVGTTVYFTCSSACLLRIVEYDMGRGKLSLIEVPLSHRYQSDTILTVTEDSRLGFAGVLYSKLYLWSWDDGAVQAWKHCRTIKLETTHDGMDAVVPGDNPQHKVLAWHDVPGFIGFADGTGFIFVRTRTKAGAVFAVELKTGRARETSLPGFPGYDPLPMPYMSFYTPDQAKGTSPLPRGGMMHALT